LSWLVSKALTASIGSAVAVAIGIREAKLALQRGAEPTIRCF
jgi:hypothetical protein